MKFLIAILFFLSFFVTISESCSCLQESIEESYCMAYWVAQTKILVRQTKSPLPGGSMRKGLNNIRYNVEYGEIYKSPLEINETLPSEIFTPSESPACGLILEAGREYLLAGRYENETMTTMLCGQIRNDDPKANSFENVLEWENVPDTLKKRLELLVFDNCNSTSTIF